MKFLIYLSLSITIFLYFNCSEDDEVSPAGNTTTLSQTCFSTTDSTAVDTTTTYSSSNETTTSTTTTSDTTTNTANPTSSTSEAYLYVYEQNDGNIAKINLQTDAVVEDWVVLPVMSDTTSDMVIKNDILYLTRGNNLYTVDTATKNVSSYDLSSSGTGALQGILFNDPTTIYIPRNASNDVVKFDLTTTSITGSPIAVGNSPSAIVKCNSKLYVANGYMGNSISVIDPTTDTVVSTISLSAGPWGQVLAKSSETEVIVNIGSAVGYIDTTTDTITEVAFSDTTYSGNGVVVGSNGKAYLSLFNWTSNATGLAVFDTTNHSIVRNTDNLLLYDIGISKTFDYMYKSNLYQSEYAYIGSGFSGEVVRIIDIQTESLVKEYNFNTGGWTRCAVQVIN